MHLKVRGRVLDDNRIFELHHLIKEQTGRITTLECSDNNPREAERDGESNGPFANRFGRPTGRPSRSRGPFGQRPTSRGDCFPFIRLSAGVRPPSKTRASNMGRVDARPVEVRALRRPERFNFRSNGLWRV